jgi:PAS domain S-box-containing protein
VSEPASPVPPADASASASTGTQSGAIGDDGNELLLAVLDHRGAIQHLNEAFVRITGWQLDELRGQRLDERLLVGVARAAAARAGEQTRVSEWTRRDGGRLAVAWSIALLPGRERHALLVGRDVSAVREAELQRRESEATFRTLAETTAAAIFIHRGAQLFYVNPAAETFTGYSRSELLSMDFWALLHPSMRAAAMAQSAARLRGEPVPKRNEVKIVTKQGQERWVEFAAATIQHHGAPAVVGTAFDISERRCAEAAQRDRERRFRALIDHSSDVVSVVAVDGRIVYLGPSVARVLGYQPHDLVGGSAYAIVHDDDQPLVAEAMRTALAQPGQPVTVQYRVRHADGTWRWMEGVGTNLSHEPLIGGIIVNVRDVTDRRRAEDRLRESEQRFALAVDGAKDGIWDWDLRRGVFYASPRMRELLDVGDEVVRDINVLFGERVHPDDHAHLRERWDAHLRGSGRHYEVEYRLRGTDGAYRWVLARGASVRDASGTLYRMVGSLTDVTQRKRAEEEARQRQAELAHVLRVSALGEMAASLAHELNQPLAAIVNYARGCARRLADLGAAPEVLTALDHIAAEALRAGEVVRGLKRVVRKEPPRDSQIDLNEVARDAIALVRNEASERTISLRLDTEPRLPRLRGDRVQVEQVILNLLRNAIEAISKRPGMVSVRTELLHERAVRMAVSDTGDGIAPDLRERVFAPFFTTKTSGLGMGLSISRTIIDAHGGRSRPPASARPSPSPSRSTQPATQHPTALSRETPQRFASKRAWNCVCLAATIFIEVATSLQFCVRGAPS